jgi:hypothetical protein
VPSSISFKDGSFTGELTGRNKGSNKLTFRLCAIFDVSTPGLEAISPITKPIFTEDIELEQGGKSELAGESGLIKQSFLYQQQRLINKWTTIFNSGNR